MHLVQYAFYLKIYLRAEHFVGSFIGRLSKFIGYVKHKDFMVMSHKDNTFCLSATQRFS